MPIIDSKTGKVKKDYTVEELVEKAKEMRAYNMLPLLLPVPVIPEVLYPLWI